MFFVLLASNTNWKKWDLEALFGNRLLDLLPESEAKAI
jgi:hypothetical protein